MTNFVAVKTIELDYGHRVPNHASKCHNTHGHRGKVEIYVQGPMIPEGDKASSEGMVMDFSDIKAAGEEIAKLFDHCMIIYKDDPIRRVLSHAVITESLHRVDVDGLCLRYTVADFGVVQELNHVPTAEYLAFLWFRMLQSRINRGPVQVAEVRFYETPTSSAIYPFYRSAVPSMELQGDMNIAR